MQTKNIFHSLLAVAAASLFTACNSDEPNNPENNRPVFTDIVTVSSMGSASTEFTFRKIDDSPLVTLTVNQAANPNNVKVGDRLAISYRSDANTQYVSSEIQVLGITGTAGNGKAIPVGKAIDNSNWFSSTISKPVLQRSGEYVNVQFFSSMYPESATIKMVIPNSLHLVQRQLRTNTRKLRILYVVLAHRAVGRPQRTRPQHYLSDQRRPEDLHNQPPRTLTGNSRRIIKLK